jgi:hypothetical protein
LITSTWHNVATSGATAAKSLKPIQIEISVELMDESPSEIKSIAYSMRTNGKRVFELEVLTLLVVGPHDSGIGARCRVENHQ